MSTPVRDPWQALRDLTPARLALGRSGDSLPTQRWLEFGLAHAQARDAVHASLDVDSLRQDVEALGYRVPVTAVASAALDRPQYLRRPDLGRQLSPEGRASLQTLSARLPAPPPLVLVLADGLSAVAVQQHAPPTLRALLSAVAAHTDVTLPVVIARQARVAIGDEIGALLGAEAVAVLIGERPGLSVADSLGIYLTWAPRMGRTDADRNCISNIHARGLSPDAAAQALLRLLAGARQLGRSGVDLAGGGSLSDPELPLGALIAG